jgi:predicted RNA-binding protein (virulence factor B family)
VNLKEASLVELVDELASRCGLLVVGGVLKDQFVPADAEEAIRWWKGDWRSCVGLTVDLQDIIVRYSGTLGNVLKSGQFVRRP